MNQRIIPISSIIMIIVASVLIVPVFAERTIVIDTSSDVQEEYYYLVLTDVKDYHLTFPDYVQSISTIQNDFGNFADISAGGNGIGMNIQIEYSLDPVLHIFSANVTKGDYAGSTLDISLEKTWSYEGKNPAGATKIHAVLKPKSSGWFSALTFVGDESIRFGLQQTLDKFGNSAKVLEKNSKISPHVSSNATQ